MSAPDLHVCGAPVWFGAIGQTLGTWLHEQSAHFTRSFLLADANAWRHWSSVLPVLPDTVVQILPMPDGEEVPGAAEQLKNLSTCERIWSAMLEAALDRRALVLTFGGGVIGDMGGFCAATYKRGVAYAQIPTTLLAMTDAALGGKVGVDFGGVKNTVGVFQQPIAVFIDPTFLQTLPLREWRSGLAEVVKHAFIGAPVLLEQLRQHPAWLLAPAEVPAETWTSVLRSSVAVKARIVEADPLESGLRALLNFGHTYGHALEAYFLNAGTPIAHGEAVAVGMLCEVENPDADLLALLRPLLPSQPLTEQMWPHLWALMQQDKKNADGRVFLALPGQQPFTLHRVALQADEAEHRWLRTLQLLG